jgi:hypothetical protein
MPETKYMDYYKFPSHVDDYTKLKLKNSSRVYYKFDIDGNVGWRHDMFGHDFDTRPHFNVEFKDADVDLHLYYDE